MKKLALIAFVAATVATPALAGDVYIVGSIGRSTVDLNKNFLDNALTSAGATSLSSTLDDSDTAYKIQVGYQYSQNFAVEGGYINLGEATYSASYTGGSANAKAEASGLNIAAVGILPINQSFSVFGKLGLIDAKVKVSANATGPGGSASGSASSTDWRPYFGAGGTYNVNKQLGIRIEYEQFNGLGDDKKTGEADVSLLSMGVVYKF